MHVFWRKQTRLEGAGRCQLLYRDFCPHPGPVKAESTFVVPGVAMVLRMLVPRLGTWIPPGFSCEGIIRSSGVAEGLLTAGLGALLAAYLFF